MKQFIIALFAVLSLCTSIYAQDFLINSTTTALNAAKNNISTQTLLIQNSNGNISLPFELNDVIEKGIIVAIINTIVVFACPVFILFIIFFFRYKNRKARYHLAEQALAAGQPLPDNLIKEKRQLTSRHKVLEILLPESAYSSSSGYSLVNLVSELSDYSLCLWVLVNGLPDINSKKRTLKTNEPTQ